MKNLMSILRRNFTYKYNKFLNPSKSMRFKDKIIVPGLNQEIQELIIKYESYKFISHSAYFLNNILFYQINDKNEFYVICEMLFQFSREVNNNRLILSLFSKLLSMNNAFLNSEEDISKLRILLSKNLFNMMMFVNILNEYEKTLIKPVNSI